jgi:hypothetical protein
MKEVSDDGRDPSLDHLLGRLAAVEDRVRRAVSDRRSVDPRPDDPFRGLYVTEADAAALLERGPSAASDSQPFDLAAELAVVESLADAAQSQGRSLRLRSLAEAFELDLVDTELVLVALAPDLDRRFERLYGYLQDDVTRRRATIDLAMGLVGLDPADAAARARLSSAGTLVARGILLVEDGDRPFLTRSLRIPDRVTGFLLGDDVPDRAVADVVEAATPLDLHGASVPLARAIAAGVRLTYLRAVPGSAAASAALGAVALAGLGVLAVDLGRVARAADPRELVAGLLLEARLRWAVVVAGPADSLVEREVQALRDLAESGWPLVLYGDRAWEPGWGRQVPLQLDAPILGVTDRARLWRAALESRPEVPGNGHVNGFLGATQAFHLTPPQIGRAIESGVLVAIAEDRDVASADLQAGARRQNAAGLEHLARRIEATAGWEDLVVPAEVAAQLAELAARARHRDRVLGEWRVGGRSVRGRGITGLFAGESGTGKTLSAEVIARELGLDLYVIDLSTVVDKYIGETEKNLDRIFSEADRVNGVLLFDEADAIFGKRSEVRDARDRYANVEVAYLLQRMERFDGLAILTTNLRANLDESFTRRLDVIVDFPTPDVPARLALWRMHLPDRLPRAADLDLEFMADRFALAGGSIRNICLTAAYFAADADSPVEMADLIRATGREYRKLGRLTIEAEFGQYHGLLAT